MELCAKVRAELRFTKFRCERRMCPFSPTIISTQDPRSNVRRTRRRRNLHVIRPHLREVEIGSAIRLRRPRRDLGRRVPIGDFEAHDPRVEPAEIGGEVSFQPLHPSIFSLRRNDALDLSIRLPRDRIDTRCFNRRAQTS